MNILGNTEPDSTFTEIKQICEPLYALGITSFDYLRAFNDGRRICLTNQPEWIEHFYQRGFHNVGTFDGSYSLYPAGYSLLPSLPHQEIMKEARDFYNIDNGIVITKPNKKFCEFIFLASTPENHQIVNFYLNNLDLLDRFILYFRDKGSKLIAEAEKRAIAIPERNSLEVQNELKNSLIGLSKNNVLRRQFLDATAIKKHHLYSKHEEICLSKAEMKCITLLLKGKTCAEIAEIQFRSKRTVENHINKVKNKLNCHSRSELISHILENNLHFADKE